MFIDRGRGDSSQPRDQRRGGKVKKRTYYSVLHVLHNDPPEAMHEAYKRVRKSHEAGLLSHDPAIIAEARLAKEAYDTLTDPARKAAYDIEHGISTPSQAAAIGMQPAPFWDATRIIVWSIMLVLVVGVYSYYYWKLSETNRSNIAIKKSERDTSKQPGDGKQSSHAGEAKPVDGAAPASDAAAPPPK
jgi:curved DNA-binding protein CbpA